MYIYGKYQGEARANDTTSLDYSLISNFNIVLTEQQYSKLEDIYSNIDDHRANNKLFFDFFELIMYPNNDLYLFIQLYNGEYKETWEYKI